MLETRNGTRQDLEAMLKFVETVYNSCPQEQVLQIKRAVEEQSNHFWLLEKQGQLVGMAFGPVVDEKAGDSLLLLGDVKSNREGRWQVLVNIMILPSDQHKGYGSILMKRIIKDCREDFRMGILLVCEEQQEQFFKKLGFTMEGGILVKGSDTPLSFMELNLNPAEEAE